MATVEERSRNGDSPTLSRHAKDCQDPAHTKAGEIPHRRPVSVCCRAEYIMTHALSTLYTCEMHNRKVEKSITGLALVLL